MNTTLTKKFIDEMKAYQQAQQKYKTDIKNKVKRQVQVVKPDATDEEIDEVLKSEGGRDALYKKTILSGGVNDQIKYVVFRLCVYLVMCLIYAQTNVMFLSFFLLSCVFMITFTAQNYVRQSGRKISGCFDIGAVCCRVESNVFRFCFANRTTGRAAGPNRI